MKKIYRETEKRWLLIRCKPEIVNKPFLLDILKKRIEYKKLELKRVEKILNRVLNPFPGMPLFYEYAIFKKREDVHAEILKGYEDDYFRYDIPFYVFTESKEDFITRWIIANIPFQTEIYFSFPSRHKVDAIAIIFYKIGKKGGCKYYALFGHKIVEKYIMENIKTYVKPQKKNLAGHWHACKSCVINNVIELSNPVPSQKLSQETRPDGLPRPGYVKCIHCGICEEDSSGKSPIEIKMPTPYYTDVYKFKNNNVYV